MLIRTMKSGFKFEIIWAPESVFNRASSVSHTGFKKLREISTNSSRCLSVN